ncbi:hypothetical protein [Nocardioides sp. AE5]|uniref:hypothetical protein n=1 Tax=Nocardioides sp. AE5 TaxID=2962573 RepID=UPI00288289B5|nr:hypothetical protein [Nocardioides sp. AE5]MDT0203528.1 hypothetical protein [Nocardioides sp. AE5]
MPTDQVDRMRPAQRWLLILIAPLTALGAGLGWGLAKSDLTGRAEDAGVSVDAVSEQVTAGSLALACALGLIVFAVVLSAFNLLRAPGTGGQKAAKVVAMVAGFVLIAAAVAIAVFVYPEFQELVTSPR